jgi:hypothetical protein
MRTRMAWTFAAFSTVLFIVDAIVTAQYLTLLSEAAIAVHGFPFVGLAALGSAIMGAVIISRDDRHAIGWLLNLMGTIVSISATAETYAGWATDHAGPGSTALATPVGWAASMLGGHLLIAGLAFLFLLAPDGHLLSPRWRYAVLLTAAGELLCMATILANACQTFDIVVENPDGAQTRPLQILGILLISFGLLASLVSMLIRFHRSQGEQRRQLRLVVLAAAAVTASLIWLLLILSLNGGRQTWAADLPILVSYLLLPICIAVAAQRYRLYDIELIINRTVVLAVGTAFAAIGYTTLVVGASNLVDRRTSDLGLSLTATTVVAIAFQPIRRRVIRLANRLAFGARAQPYEALADFSHRLAETPSPLTLLSAVADAAGRAVSARGVTAFLELPDGEAISASWGESSADATHEHVVLVREGDTILGRIAVTFPKGRTMRPSDLPLLQALADQAAVAFRNSAMEAQLARHVSELARTTHELAGSRSRIIEADDTVRRTLSTAIARDVLPHLIAVSEQLNQRVGVDAHASRRIDELLDGVNAALASLRELTRGVFPTQLARTGLEPTLRSFLSSAGRSATLQVDPSASGKRFAARIEAAVYFCSTEAVGAGGRSVNLAVTDNALIHTVAGVTRTSLDLRAISDRVAAVGGVVGAEDDVLMLSIPLGEQSTHESPADRGPDL